MSALTALYMLVVFGPIAVLDAYIVISINRR